MSTNQDTQPNNKPAAKGKKPEDNSNVTPINVMNHSSAPEEAAPKAKAETPAPKSKAAPAAPTKKAAPAAKKKAATSPKKAQAKATPKKSTAVSASAIPSQITSTTDTATMLSLFSKKSREFNHEFIRSLTSTVQNHFDHFNTMIEICEETYELALENTNAANASLNKITDSTLKCQERVFENSQKTKEAGFTVDTMKNQCSQSIEIMDDMISSSIDAFIDLSTSLSSKTNDYTSKNQDRWFKLAHFE
ncbi:MAG: hypothetical protein MK137_02990 [Rickettsiales bacterium]|nr:hypothetical protein [Rickettsiales bacterium]